jgi:hypothetical protein
VYPHIISLLNKIYKCVIDTVCLKWERRCQFHIMINDEGLSHSFLSSLPAFQLALLVPVQSAYTEYQVQVKRWLFQKEINNKISKRTISHFLMLVVGKSHCYIFYFSMEGSCASAHTLAHELVVPVKWVRVPQEDRFMYFTAVCQHLQKKGTVSSINACCTHTQSKHTTNIPK